MNKPKIQVISVYQSQKINTHLSAAALMHSNVYLFSAIGNIMNFEFLKRYAVDDSRIRKLTNTIPYLVEQTSDLFYLTGLTLSKGRLLVKEGKAILFVDSRYIEIAKKQAPCEVALWDQLKHIQDKEIFFDSSFMSYDAYQILQSEHPGVHWIAKPNLLREFRAIKDGNEIVALKKAANLTWKGYQYIATLLKESITEEDLAFEFEFYCRKHGACGLSFSPIIAFGENSAYPHHRAGKTRLKKGQSVLIDVGAVVDRYCADMTRLIYFKEPENQILQLEEIVKKAKQKAIEAIKPGIKCGYLDEIVRDVFDKANVKQLYMHSLGHGIGLDAHEFPKIRYDGLDKDILLKPGMVITIEPGLYLPGIGGVRLEDMVVVTNTGCENFFHDI